MVFMGNIMNFNTPNNDVPALAPPSGVTSNFVYPFSLSPAFVTTAVLCLQIMRIFVPTKRGLVFRLIQILIWLNVSFYTANVLSVIFQCVPVPKA